MANKNNLLKGHKPTQFTSKNQPSPEAKKRGWAKRRFMKDIALSLVEGDYKAIADKMCDKLGIERGSIDLETLSDLRQLEKSITKGDTQAYRAFKEYLRGKPKQAIDITETKKSISIDAVDAEIVEIESILNESGNKV